MMLMTQIANSTVEKFLDKIQRLRYIDDIFLSVALDGYKPGVELILRIVTGIRHLRVLEIYTQKVVTNLYGRGVCFDIFAYAKNRRFNCEIQRHDSGAIPLRARYNSAMMDSREIQKGTDFSDLPENIVIFICENDVLGKGLPLYHIRRVVEETGEKFADKALIIYVNGQYRGNDPVGKLMHDFFCEKSEDMNYKELADRMSFVKNNEGGVRRMCKIMEDLVKEENSIILKREQETRISRALSMNILPLDKIAEMFEVPLSRVTEIGRAHALL